MTIPYQVKKKVIGGYVVTYDCPHCRAGLTSSLEEAGTTQPCPTCNNQFVVPGKADRDKLQAAQEAVRKAKADEKQIEQEKRQRQLAEREQLHANQGLKPNGKSHLVLALVGAALLMGVGLFVMRSRGTGGTSPAASAAQPVTLKGDEIYSFIRLLWVSHGPLHEVTTESPAMEALGIAHGTETTEAPQLYRIIEGEVLGIGRGHWPRFRYLPFVLDHRREVFDNLAKQYPQLVEIDESNGASGELHVARLRNGLWVAWFGSWYNPWSIVVTSAAEGSHTNKAIDEWAKVSAMFSEYPADDRTWFVNGAKKGEAARDSKSVSYSVSTMDRETAGFTMLIFTATSQVAPPKPYKGKTP